MNFSMKSKISPGNFFCKNAPIAAVIASGAKTKYPTTPAPILSDHLPNPVVTFTTSSALNICTLIAWSVPDILFQPSASCLPCIRYPPVVCPA